MKYDQCNGGVGERRRNTCTKVEGRDVSVNTYYSQYLFRNCCASVVNQRNPQKRTVANPTAPQEKSLKSPSTSSTLKAASKLKKKSRVETLCEKKASQRKL